MENSDSDLYDNLVFDSLVSCYRWLVLRNRIDGWIDGWMDGWTDRWMDGWMDGWGFTAL